MLSSSAEVMHSALSWSSPQLPGVEISRCHHAGPLPRFRLIPLVQIGLLLAGEAVVRWGSDTWRETPGQFMVAAPDCNFRILRRISETATTLRVFVAPAVFDQWMCRNDGPTSAGFRLCHGADPDLTAELRTLQRNMEQSGEPSVLAEGLDRVLARVRHLLLSTTRPAKDRRSEIRMAIQILRERFASTVSLDDLAEKVGLSKFHLLRLFRDEVGLGPHAFQLQLRVSLARELLTSGTSVADVAAACGFADQAHLTRCFKSAVGYTPGAFRRLA